MDLEHLVLFNLCEAALWGVLAAIVFLRWRKKGGFRLVVAAFILVLFGISDLVETQTGAWWRPWWLLVWKVSCVAALLGLLLWHRRARR